jgi:hypothetical protein
MRKLHVSSRTTLAVSVTELTNPDGSGDE